ncbi:hypothetical protein JMUB7529_28140 [Staphylococcus aureus]
MSRGLGDVYKRQNPVSVVELLHTAGREADSDTVSYTHLTLPTKA